MKQKLIIAEDNLECSKHIYNAIKEKNLEIDVVGIAENGEETLQMLEKYNPNILILDLKMPNKSGLDVLNELKENDIKIQVIIISGEIPMVNRINIINSGIVCNIFVKPFDYEQLCSSIELICKNFNKKNNNEFIDEVLHNFQFNFSSIFYQYLVKCIDKATYRSIPLKQLYKEISDNVNDDKRIRWGIEKLITSMIRYTPREKIKQYFLYTDKPSAKIFIMTMADLIKEKIGE